MDQTSDGDEDDQRNRGRRSRRADDNKADTSWSRVRAQLSRFKIHGFSHRRRTESTQPPEQTDSKNRSFQEAKSHRTAAMNTSVTDVGQQDNITSGDPATTPLGQANTGCWGAELRSSSTEHLPGARSEEQSRYDSDELYSHLTEKEKRKRSFVMALRARYKIDYDRVQPIPYIKDRLYCVDKVYVEGGYEFMTSGDIRGAGSWRRLESYKAVFSDPRMRSNRRIIEGEPGFGETTCTLQLAYDWCNHIGESPLRDVEILILLRLRQLRGVRSIYRAIQVYLLNSDTKINEADIGVIIKESQSVVVILDGYDEYPNRNSSREDDVQRILKLDLFQNVQVILTTRYLPDYLAPTTKRIRLTGFDELARVEYIRKAVVGVDDVEGLRSIRQRLKANPVLEDLCQVPLVYVMFAHIANENEDFQNFRSVTDFFRYMITCFHEHLRNKTYESNVRRYIIPEDDHAVLDQLAFSAISKEHQQITWNRKEMYGQLGVDMYDTYLAIGVLIEEDVFLDSSSKDIDVRFYHKLFCEWYAANHIVNILSKSDQSVSLDDVFHHVDPEDLQYVYRFACGLNPDVGSSIIQYLTRSREGAHRFAVLCMLERSGDVTDILGTVRDMCSDTLTMNRNDTRLLQRSTVQLLDIAAGNGIPVSCLQLDGCFAKFDVSNSHIILQSGLQVTNLKTVKMMQVEKGGGRVKVTREELVGLLQACEALEEIRFVGNYLLPLSVPAELISLTLETRNIKISNDRCHGVVHQLNWDDGQWQHQITADRSVRVDIFQEELDQQWGKKELAVLSAAGVSITQLLLQRSFSNTTDNTQSIILTSGCTIPVLHTLREFWIQYTDVDLEMFFRILAYIEECTKITQLGFGYCKVPDEVDAKMIPHLLKQRGLKVYWFTETGEEYLLDLDAGNWKKQ